MNARLKLPKEFTTEIVRAMPPPDDSKRFKDYSVPGLHALKVRRRKLATVYVVRKGRREETIGDALVLEFEDACEKTRAVLKSWATGEPMPVAEKGRTLADAWERFDKREDLAPRTAKLNRATFKYLARLAEQPLKTLQLNPGLAEDEHRRIGREHGKVVANHAMRLLRAIYRFEAKRDRSLSLQDHPCTSVQWFKEKPRDAAMDKADMPTWHAQIEALRVGSSPQHASFNMLCLLLGTRPGELARARRADYDRDGRVLTLCDTKAAPFVEIPLTDPAIAELDRAVELAGIIAGNNKTPWIFPSEKSGAGHITRWARPETELCAQGNAMRHTHRTIAHAVGVDELTIDMLQGRNLRRTGGHVGRGYLSKRVALGDGSLPAAQQRITDEILRRLAITKT